MKKSIDVHEIFRKITESNLYDMLPAVIQAIPHNDMWHLINGAADNRFYFDRLIYNCLWQGHKECSKILINELAAFGYRPDELIKRHIGDTTNPKVFESIVYSLNKIPDSLATRAMRVLLFNNNLKSVKLLLSKVPNELFFKAGVIDANIWSICEYSMQKRQTGVAGFHSHDIMLATFFLKELELNLKPPHITEECRRILEDAGLL